MNKCRQRITLLVTSISYALVISDTSIVNVGLENIARGFGTDVTGFQWIVTAYVIVFASSDSLRIEDGCRRWLCRVPARSARPAWSHHHAAYVRQDRRVLRRVHARDGEDDNRAAFKEAESFPPLNYEKKGGTIDLSFWRAPERLFDEPDELVTWARVALAAARRVTAKRVSMTFAAS